MNDGRLYMSQRWVKAAGGCSAPNGKKLSESLLGKMKLRFDETTSPTTRPNLVQLMIRHPNESPLAADFVEGQAAVRAQGESHLRRQDGDGRGVDFSLSDNPNFRFFFTPEEKGQLKIEVEDTHDRKFSIRSTSPKACRCLAAEARRHGASVDRPNPLRIKLRGFLILIDIPNRGSSKP